QSRRPVVQVAPGTGSRKYLAVRGVPGQVYTLSWFPPVSHSLPIPVGSWYFTTLSAADPADSFDPTGLVFRTTADRSVIRSAAQGVPIDHGHPLSRTFNLTGTQTTLLDVTEAGSYRITVKGG